MCFVLHTKDSRNINFQEVEFVQIAGMNLLIIGIKSKTMEWINYIKFLFTRESVKTKMYDKYVQDSTDDEVGTFEWFKYYCNNNVDFRKKYFK